VTRNLRRPAPDYVSQGPRATRAREYTSTGSADTYEGRRPEETVLYPRPRRKWNIGWRPCRARRPRCFELLLERPGETARRRSCTRPPTTGWSVWSRSCLVRTLLHALRRVFACPLPRRAPFPLWLCDLPDVYESNSVAGQGDEASELGARATRVRGRHDTGTSGIGRACRRQVMAQR
jgi:hypothetical protein